MTEPEARRIAAELLRKLPLPGEAALPAASICDGMGLDPEQAETVGQVLITLLNAFGVLAVKDCQVRADHVTSSLFLRSLAEYVDTGTPILGNWARARVGEPPYLEQEALAGPQFLYLMERQRGRLSPRARPLRRVKVAQVVVKARLRGQGVNYLIMYDSAADQYQLPGGRMRPADPGMREVAVRELEEELSRFVFDSRTDQLVELGTAEITQPSRTLGALTAYEIAFFQLRSSRAQLLAGPDARWVKPEILLEEGTQVNRAGLNMAGLRRLHDSLPDGIGALPLSLMGVQRRTLRAIVRDRPWEFYGLVLGVLGIIISIILFFLE
ncbi:NUDIX domain-containing protein [Nonomuraea harbinensis]|uniref:NUDIX domain-containing protein n=1 Tax=Nonomuraea harbinensis TaxID=1286938 RepID=A0ABW1C0D4_9ACTN|nr:NUDIX domain-containing protein [Nonomuraea harbinensis]